VSRRVTLLAVCLPACTRFFLGISEKCRYI
jgi:hypothetical protein